jgi:hypothetical protein
MIANRRILLLAMAAAVATGCSSSAKMTMRQPKAAGIASGHSVALALTSDGDEDSREVAQKVRSSLYGRLVSEGIFKQVVNADQDADYAMDVKLSGVDMVSQGARIFFGVLAGANELTADVTVRDRQNNGTITAFSVSGESAAHPMSSENDMDDAIDEVVTKIVEALR